MTDNLMQRLRQRSAIATDDECSEAAHHIATLEQRIAAAIDVLRGEAS
jgi:hypothetical protein